MYRFCQPGDYSTPTPGTRDFSHSTIWSDAATSVVVLTGIRGEMISTFRMEPGSVFNIQALNLNPGIWLLSVQSERINTFRKILILNPFGWVDCL